MGMPQHRYSFALHFDITRHAHERINERLSLSTNKVLHLLNAGQTIALNNPLQHERHRAYYLFYSVADRAFFVAVAALNDSDSPLTLVTVLTREQAEQNSGTQITVLDRKRAARSVLSAREYTEWKASMALAPDAEIEFIVKQRRFYVRYEFMTPEGPLKSVRLGWPKIKHEDLVKSPIDAVKSTPGFWDWVAQKIVDNGLPLDTAMGIYAVTVNGEAYELQNTLIPDDLADRPCRNEIYPGEASP